jgi:hypothetical protein
LHGQADRVLRRTISAKNTGNPTKAVTTPIGDHDGRR